MTRPSLLFRVINSVRGAYKFHGIWFPFIILHRAWLCFFRKTISKKTFVFRGKPQRYSIHPFTLDNERTVEISIAEALLKNRTGSILEVGNVLSNYLSFPHDVVDKYEKAPGVINEDIVSYSPGKSYDFIVTLSTLEHVGWDETPREPEKIHRAIAHLKGLLKGGGELVATLPLGYNTYVDQILATKQTGFTECIYLKRINSANEWREVSLEEVVGAAYGSPYLCANAICVGFFRKDGGS
jgi:hypothetical protein